MKFGHNNLKCNDKRYYYRKVYLLSEHWKKLKSDKLRESPTCLCGTSKNLDVHHLEYKNLYDVTLKDLKTLCRRCHTKEHNRIDKIKLLKNNEKNKKWVRDRRRRLIRRVSKKTNLDKRVVNTFL